VDSGRCDSSAASSLAWIARLLGASEADLLRRRLRPKAPSHVNFLPYLSGESTPHGFGEPEARGMLDGLSHGTDRAAIVQAVLEALLSRSQIVGRELPTRDRDLGG